MINTEEEIKITREEKIKALKEALINGGFYGSNNVWNSIIRIHGDNHIYRKRVETIIIRNNKEIFLKKRPDNTYFFPGGSTEKDIPDYIQAINECREEARINIRNIESTGLSYKELKKNDYNKNKNFLITWDGNFTDIYIAEYDSRYKGHVDKVDKDSFIESGRFYSTKEAITFLNPIHREALIWYLKNHIMDDEMITESTKSKSVFFVSDKNFNNQNLKPRIPDNFFTRNGYENNTTARVCFSTSISGCLIGLSRNLAGEDLYVHIPIGDGIIIKPTKEDVPEILYSKERWSLQPVKLKTIGKIHVEKAHNKPHRFRYGDNLVGETYEWNWKWIQENTIIENGEMKMREFTTEDIRLAIIYESVFLNEKLEYMSETEKGFLFTYLTEATGEKVTPEQLQAAKDKLKEAKKKFAAYNKDCARTIRMPEDDAKWEGVEAIDLSREIDKAQFALRDIEEAYRKQRLAEHAEMKKNQPPLKDRITSKFKEKAKAVTESVIDALDDVLTESLEEGVMTESSVDMICDAFMMEKVLTGAERDALPTKSFGIPSQRKFPLNDEKHVRYAISMFNKVEKQYEEILARNIKRAMRKFGIDKSCIGTKNRLSEYFL